MKNRQEITPHSLPDRQNIDFNKIKINMKTLEDATLTIGDYQKLNSSLSTKMKVLQAIQRGNFEEMYKISNYFFKISGIYSRLIRYIAYLYRYDWMVTPYYDKDDVDTKKLTDKFTKVLEFLDNFKIKRVLGEIALKVVKNGCYYGYIIRYKNRAAIQELPIKYCRSRFKVDNKPVVEFNMKFFDDYFTDATYRQKILNLFPDEFKKGYRLYKLGKLPASYPGDQAGWYILDIHNAVKFNLNDDDQPFMISVIPAIIDLDAAQELDKKKLEQELLKIIIQKLPLDKNGDMLFDMEEAAQMHNNAVAMIGRAIGVDVLTTFADVDVEDMADSTHTTNTDDLERIERAVYNEAGVSQMQFNTDGNIALEKSILNDEASIYNLILKFEDFLNDLVLPFNSSKKLRFRVQILTTTIYNYKEMAKLYKEQTQLGYSKMLPQIALGQLQSSVLANAYFENDVLDLVNVFIPPMSSNVMNAEVLNLHKGDGGEDKQGGGRPEKPDDEKSEKTIKNKESMS